MALPLGARGAVVSLSTRRQAGHSRAARGAKRPPAVRFGCQGYGLGRLPVLYGLCALARPACMSRSALAGLTPLPIAPLRQRRRALDLARGASGFAWSTVSCASSLACRASRSASDRDGCRRNQFQVVRHVHIGLAVTDPTRDFHGGRCTSASGL